MGRGKGKLKRAIPVSELESTKYRDFPWDGAWLDLFGDVELAGTWLAHGDTGNGKTSFALQLCRYLAEKGVRCVYNSLEQGNSKSMRKQVLENHLNTVQAGYFFLLNKESINDLKVRLRGKRSPEFIVIDSLQYTGITYKQYQELKDEFGDKKLILFLSHGDGKKPLGSVANRILFDVDVKILIDGYRAFVISRLGGGKYYDIWPEMSANIHIDNL